MILTSNNWYDDLESLMSLRTIQVIILGIISMFLCQFLKFMIFSIRNKKIMFSTLFTTGGMPSSHTATVTTLIVSMGMLQMHDNGNLDYSFAVALVFGMIVVHDAMGVRLEASKHAKILNNLVSAEDIKTKQDLGFGKKGKLKELLGHKGFEVLGGFVFGLIVGIIGYFVII